MSKFGNSCKVCSTKWTETPTLTGDLWYDCLKCEKTAEQIEKEEVKATPTEIEEVDWTYTGMLL